MQHDETADDEEKVDTGCTSCRQPVRTEPACRTVGLLQGVVGNYSQGGKRSEHLNAIELTLVLLRGHHAYFLV